MRIATLIICLIALTSCSSDDNKGGSINIETYVDISLKTMDNIDLLHPNSPNTTI